MDGFDLYVWFLFGELVVDGFFDGVLGCWYVGFE